ncbi:hypothetical protein [Roseibium sp.]|uniref:hypothetical protein n=1 Tax=Roseibium sp. TaxID=1936156 RepID=UPI003BB106F8
MIVTWLLSRLRNKRTTHQIQNNVATGVSDAPDWMARDLGLDDPDNRKAVARGGCRNKAFPTVSSPSRQPRRS